MKCPVCKCKINPLRVSIINRWRNITCPCCHAELNRKIDIQFILISLLGSVIAPFMIITYLFNFWLGVFVTFAGIFGLILLDGFTVKLVQAKHKGTPNNQINQDAKLNAKH